MEKANNEKSHELRVWWDSDRPFPDGTIDFTGRTYTFRREEENAEVYVFDATRWDDPLEALKGVRGRYLPVFVISRDGDEATWLQALPEPNEVCAESRAGELLPLLLARMCVRNHERKRIMDRSLVDSLTGLLPRVELTRRLELEIYTATPDSRVALILLDLDHFKAVNDEYGHMAGDSILRQVGKLLKDVQQGASGAYRAAGEKFAIVTRLDRTQAIAFGEFIRGEIEEAEFIYNGVHIPVTASIGIALNGGDTDREQFMERADTAMYQAKALGRNRIVEYSEYYDEVEQEGSDPEIRDFDNRIRVLTERLSGVLAAKSRQMMTQYKKEAEFDGLTGLFIRRYFDRRMNREFEKAVENGRPLSLVFIDIDFFGRVNKTYGFPTGDKALQMVTAGIKRCIRTVDWAARYGGEEFCVVLPDTPEQDAVKIARRIWEEVGRERIYAFDGRAFGLTLSIGVAQVDPHDTDLQTFIQRTSDRTRFAKQNGRNQVCCDDMGELCEDPGEEE